MNLENAPRDVTLIAKEEVVEVDVRPILRSGGEPFSVIMNAIGKTPPTGGMRLRATFQPVPLFRVLGSQGWAHWVEHGEGDDWIIWFYREGARPAEGREEKPGAHADACAKKTAAEISHLLREFPELKGRLEADEAACTWTLDVRGMAPPEPMELTLSALERVPSGIKLIQVNERVPQFLLPLLDERGFAHEVRHLKGEVRVSIARKG